MQITDPRQFHRFTDFMQVEYIKREKSVMHVEFSYSGVTYKVRFSESDYENFIDKHGLNVIEHRTYDPVTDKHTYQKYTASFEDLWPSHGTFLDAVHDGLRLELYEATNERDLIVLQHVIESLSEYATILKEHGQSATAKALKEEAKHLQIILNNN